MAKTERWSDAVKVCGSDEQRSFILSHRAMISRISWQVASGLPVGVDLNDLISEGFLGLIKAIQGFDPDRGVAFSTYAEGRVRGAMLDGLRTLDWMPRSMRGHMRQMEKARSEVRQRKGAEATAEELACEMSVSLDSLYRSLRSMAQGVDAPLPGVSLDPEQVCSGSFDPHSSLLEKESRQELQRMVEGLSLKEQIVIRLYYHGERTLKEIGAFLGVSESRVCQIHRRALMKIRSALEDHDVGVGAISRSQSWAARAAS